MGAVIENHIGAIFAWGILVNGAYLPGSFTYAYGFLQVMHLLILILILVAIIDVLNVFLIPSVAGCPCPTNSHPFLLFAPQVRYI